MILPDGRSELIGGDGLTAEQLQFFIYNGRDAAVTGEIQAVQEKELKLFGMMHALEHEMALQPICMHMTRTGILIDKVEVVRMREGLTNEIANLQKFLDSVAGKAVNAKSSPDMLWLCYTKLGLPVKLNKLSGRPTADKFALATLAAKHNSPVLNSVLEIRSRRDDIERYLDIGIDADSVWRALFDPAGTRTGRLASRANIYGTGNNLQNIPSRLRRIFVARPGKVLFYVDYSQAEARVVAYLARCKSLIGLFNDPKRDIHSANAVRFFGLACPEADVKASHDGLRYAAKRIVHGSNYGEGPARVVESANDDARRTGNAHRLDFATARRGQEAYFLIYPEIKSVFWQEIVQELRHTRTLTTPAGWKRQFFARWDEKLLNAAYAFVPQNTIGIMTEKAQINLWDAQQGKWNLPEGCEVLANGHDSLLGEAPIDRLDECLDAVHAGMMIPVQIHGETCVIPTDTQTGKNWAPWDEKTNPEGLKKYKRG